MDGEREADGDERVDECAVEDEKESNNFVSTITAKKEVERNQVGGVTKSRPAKSSLFTINI